MTELTKEENALLEELKSIQKGKKNEFAKTLLDDKNKKLYQHKLVIEWSEIIDFEKLPLVYEKSSKDIIHNKEIIKAASVNNAADCLRFAKNIADNPKFYLDSFQIFDRMAETDEAKPNVKILGVDLNTGKMDELSDVPPEVLKAVCQTLSGIVAGEEKREEKGTEAEAATV